MSGETLRAPRQQLRRLRASAFDLALDFQGLLKSATIARLSGARRVFGFSRDATREPPSRFLLSKTIPTSKKLHVITKNLSLVSGALGIPVPERFEELQFPIGTSPAHHAEAETASHFHRGQFRHTQSRRRLANETLERRTLWQAGRRALVASWSSFAGHTWSRGGSLGRHCPEGEPVWKSPRRQSFFERVSTNWRNERAFTLAATPARLIWPSQPALR